jgi:hypothetical protein
MRTIRSDAHATHNRSIRAAALGMLVFGVLAVFAHAADAAGGPSIESFAVSHVTEHSARLEAAIHPHGAATKYALWVYYPACQHGAGECSKPPQTERLGGGDIAAGNVSVLVKKVVRKLQHGCEYTFWVTAVNAFGEATSPRETVTTAGSEGLGCLR